MNLPLFFSALLIVVFVHFSSGQYVQPTNYVQQPTNYGQPTNQYYNNQPYYNNQQNYNQNGQCPTGWAADGSCTFSTCFQTSQLCNTANKACCKINPSAAVQAYQRNPKTGQCVLTYCPAGSYNDGACKTTSICFDQTETCVMGECCEKSYLPGFTQPGNNGNSQPCTNTGYQNTGQQYPYGTTNNLVQPTYNQPLTTNTGGQIIGYTANGQPVYSTNPTQTYNNGQYPYGQTYPTNTYPTNTYPNNNAYPYTTNNLQQPYNTNPSYTNTNNGYNPYNTNTGGQQIDPTLLAQACQQGDQSSCAQAIAQQSCSTTIQLSCPVQCGLCGTTNYGRK